jgi:hypothetical protein
LSLQVFEVNSHAEGKSIMEIQDLPREDLLILAEFKWPNGAKGSAIFGANRLESSDFGNLPEPSTRPIRQNASLALPIQQWKAIAAGALPVKEQADS